MTFFDINRQRRAPAAGFAARQKNFMGTLQA